MANIKLNSLYSTLIKITRKSFQTVISIESILNASTLTFEQLQRSPTDIGQFLNTS